MRETQSEKFRAGKFPSWVTTWKTHLLLPTLLPSLLRPGQVPVVGQLQEVPEGGERQGESCWESVEFSLIVSPSLPPRPLPRSILPFVPLSVHVR